MDINTGIIYPSLEEALADGVDEKNLVTAKNRETLEELRDRLDLHSKYEPHQGNKERTRRLKQLQAI